MQTAFLLGRILFGGYFIWSGLNHFIQHAMLTQYASAKHVPMASLAVAISGLMILLGGLSILLGAWPRLGALAIMVFLLAVSLMMHNFWVESDPSIRTADEVNFTKNMALVGATLMFYGIPKPWPKSVGR